MDQVGQVPGDRAGRVPGRLGQREVGGQRRRVGEQHAVPGTCVLSARVPGTVISHVMARPCADPVSTCASSTGAET
jgi:hypothetical protein